MKHPPPVGTLVVILLLALFSLSSLGCQPQASAGPGMQLLYVSSEGSLVLADIGDPPGARITLKELHHVGEGSVGASWSPDGERIMIRHRETLDIMDLWVYEVSSGEATPLLQGVEGAIETCWSPDGERIIVRYQETSDGLDLWLYEVSSGEMTQIVQGYDVFGYGDIDWLPDGEHFVFDYGTGVSRGLVVFKIGEAVPATTLGYFGWHAWPPAGNQIAYRRERVVDPPTPMGSGESGDVAIYDIATGETTTLVEGTSVFVYYPEAWPAPDRLLVWRHSVRASTTKRELLVYNPQDPESTPQPLEALPWHMDRDAIVEMVPPDLSEAFESNGQYSVSGDLTHVAISVPSSHLRDAEVWVLSADGSQAFKVADDGQHGGRPLWRPGKDQLTSGNP